MFQVNLQPAPVHAATSSSQTPAVIAHQPAVGPWRPMHIRCHSARCSIVKIPGLDFYRLYINKNKQEYSTLMSFHS